MKTERIAVTETYPLRSEVLRPGLPIEATHFDGDHDSATEHWGLRNEAGALLVIASFMLRPFPGDQNSGAYQLRGMATAPGEQGKGYGGKFMNELIAHYRRNGTREIWCNARTSAEKFYERLGFETEGKGFDMGGIGPHVVMRLVFTGTTIRSSV